MLLIGGCRADELAAEFGTPTLFVAETGTSGTGARVQAPS